ncbi:acyltransferase [Paenisporosarcina antarctica]|uniref:Acyltransferase n=1 Tax=Paenisporosarcina antarctica TaxID=417367 RepID=A0A4P6ZZJ3_9BACL|nr:acyltransferase [Paenisporosarcina antarctica]QBP41907.1 acyltransferase [Paenisporosarcina antarctica]
MKSDFEFLLDMIIGPREFFYVMECDVCGFDEIHFQHPITKKQIGIACKGCHFVCKLDFVANPNDNNRYFSISY